MLNWGCIWLCTPLFHCFTQPSVCCCSESVLFVIHLHLIYLQCFLCFRIRTVCHASTLSTSIHLTLLQPQKLGVQALGIALLTGDRFGSVLLSMPTLLAACCSLSVYKLNTYVSGKCQTASLQVPLMERIYRSFWYRKGDVFALLWDMQR